MIDPNELHVTHDFQAFVTGILLGTALRVLSSKVEIPPDDENGRHRPYFDVIGVATGTRVRVMVVTVE